MQTKDKVYIVTMRGRICGETTHRFSAEDIDLAIRAALIKYPYKKVVNAREEKGR
tara:strand:- start:864 stop:1028 length:165 start_codon:yes stop_codon:yes gene_type:complete